MDSAWQNNINKSLIFWQVRDLFLLW
jgi:hypothetical protein